MAWQRVRGAEEPHDLRDRRACGLGDDRQPGELAGAALADQSRIARPARVTGLELGGWVGEGHQSSPLLTVWRTVRALSGVCNGKNRGQHWAFSLQPCPRVPLSAPVTAQIF